MNCDTKVDRNMCNSHTAVSGAVNPGGLAAADRVWGGGRNELEEHASDEPQRAGWAKRRLRRQRRRLRVRCFSWHSRNTDLT